MWVGGIFLWAEFAHSCVLVAPFREERPNTRRGMLAHEKAKSLSDSLKDLPFVLRRAMLAVLRPASTSEWLEPFAAAISYLASTLPVLSIYIVSRSARSSRGAGSGYNRLALSSLTL